MPDTHDVGGPKRPVNLSIDADLLREATALGIDLSQTLETRLVELVRAERQQRWLDENRGALDDYNARIERDGLWSDGERLF